MRKELSIAPEGVELTVARLGEGALRLESLGFAPGAAIVLLTKSRCGVTVRLRGIKYALGREISERIFVDIPASQK